MSVSVKRDGLRFVKQFFNHDAHLGIAGEMNEKGTLVRTAVMIRYFKFMSPEAQKYSIKLAKEQIRRQFRTRSFCVYGEYVLEGNEVELEY